MTTAALGVGFERCQYRHANTLSGGEQKRLVLEYLLRGPDEVLLLDEPDNYLDVPGKRWLEDQLRATPKTVLLVSRSAQAVRVIAHKLREDFGLRDGVLEEHVAGQVVAAYVDDDYARVADVVRMALGRQRGPDGSERCRPQTRRVTIIHANVASAMGT